MAGHSHAKNVKHKKERSDQKKSAVFSKLLKAITITAKHEPNPDFNPTLRSTIDKAKKFNVPNDTIERAIKKSGLESVNLEELTMECYGPEGVAILITAITDNRNRTISEVKNIINKADAKWAESGSVLWAFTLNPATNVWQSNFPQEISANNKTKLSDLIAKIENQADVQTVFHNAKNL